MPPPLSSPCRLPRASHAAEQTQRSSSSPRPIRSHGHRCTCPTRALRPRWVKRPGDLDHLTLKVVSELRVMWATSVPVLVFLGLSSVRVIPGWERWRQTCVRSTSVLHQGSRRHRIELPGVQSRERLRHRQAANDDDDDEFNVVSQMLAVWTRILYLNIAHVCGVVQTISLFLCVCVSMYLCVCRCVQWTCCWYYV